MSIHLKFRTNIVKTISVPIFRVNNNFPSEAVAVMSQTAMILTLSTLGKIFSRQHFKTFFLFSRKQDLTFHANCLQWRQFA